MGKAVICGYWNALEGSDGAPADSNDCSHPDDFYDRTSMLYTPGRYIITVGSAKSAAALERELKPWRKIWKIDIRHGNEGNKYAAANCDLAILACKPKKVEDVLSVFEPAKHKRSIVSLVGGCSHDRIRAASNGHIEHIGRVMPNTAIAVKQGMTVIAEPENSDEALPESHDDFIEFMFQIIGRVVTLPSNLMDASTALCGSGPAFAALVIEAMANGGVAMGIPSKQAMEMANTAVRGATKLIQDGQHPAILREKVSTPGGCTIAGLMAMEEGAVRSSVGKAIKEATLTVQRAGLQKIPERRETSQSNKRKRDSEA